MLWASDLTSVIFTPLSHRPKIWVCYLGKYFKDISNMAIVILYLFEYWLHLKVYINLPHYCLSTSNILSWFLIESFIHHVFHIFSKGQIIISKTTTPEILCKIGFSICKLSGNPLLNLIQIVCPHNILSLSKKFCGMLDINSH